MDFLRTLRHTACVRQVLKARAGQRVFVTFEPPVMLHESTLSMFLEPVSDNLTVHIFEPSDTSPEELAN